MKLSWHTLFFVLGSWMIYFVDHTPTSQQIYVYAGFLVALLVLFLIAPDCNIGE